MPSKYDKVPVKGISWNKILKIIRDESPKGIALYDLADRLGVKRNSREMDVPIESLTRTRRIQTMMGKSKSGLPCVVAVVTEKGRAMCQDKQIDLSKELEAYTNG